MFTHVYTHAENMLTLLFTLMVTHFYTHSSKHIHIYVYRFISRFINVFNILSVFKGFQAISCFSWYLFCKIEYQTDTDTDNGRNT